VLVAGCGSAKPSGPGTDGSVKDHLLRGVAQIRTTHDLKKLRGQLVRTLATLREDRPRTAAGRRARQLAIQGFAWTLKSIESTLDFTENDSGNVEAATRDAKRAYHSLERSANLLRAAGRAVGLRIGKLNGH
jgi:hypothetical protein